MVCTQKKVMQEMSAGVPAGDTQLGIRGDGGEGRGRDGV